MVVNALAESPWGTFTVGFTIPLALLMGLYMYRFRKGKIAEASIIGIVGLLFAVWLGGRIAESSIGTCVHVVAQYTDCVDGRLWFYRFCTAGLDAAVSARLLVVLSQDWHHRFSDSWRDRGRS